MYRTDSRFKIQRQSYYRKHYENEYREIIPPNGAAVTGTIDTAIALQIRESYFTVYLNFQLHNTKRIFGNNLGGVRVSF